MAAFQYAYRIQSGNLWKSWRIRKHRKWDSLVEILAPVVLVLILVAVKAVMNSDSPLETDKPTVFLPHNYKHLLMQLCSLGCSAGGVTSYLAYTPRNIFTDQLMKNVQRILTRSGVDLNVVGFSQEYEIEGLNSLLTRNSSGYFGKPSALVGGIVFMSRTGQKSDLTYKIRLRSSKFITGRLFSDIEIPGPGQQYEVYERTGFLGLQMAIDQSFIRLVGAKKMPYNMETQAFPYPPYTVQEKSHYTMVVATLIPSAIIIGFTYMIGKTIHGITEEKQTGVKKYLGLLGLGKIGYWLGWFLNTFLTALISILLILIVLNMDVSDEGSSIQFSSKTVILVFLILYVMASLWFCFFLTTILPTASYASSLGVIIWLITFVIPAILTGTQQRYLATQLLILVLPNMGLYWGFRIIASWESRVIGIQWDNLTEYPNTTDSLNLALVIAMFVFNIVLYITITVFVRRREPSSRRIKPPFTLLYDVLYDDTNFPEFVRFFKKGIVCRKKKKSNETIRKPGIDITLDSPIGILRTEILEKLGLITLLHEDNSKLSITNDQQFIEPVVDGSLLHCGVKVRNISKSFQTNLVLQNITCDFFTGDISFILGKNSGGKTTFVQLLIGSLLPDEGTAYINDYDVHEYKTEVIRSIGLCPQENMLIPDLTVMEHLILFAWMKGKDWDQSIIQARQISSIFQLNEYSKTTVSILSKSTTRILSCALSVMGDPQVIILDEPTRDMDAEMCKILWSYLAKIKHDKTIIVTSQSITEAGLVGDRIVILNEGKLRCIGSPDFIHSSFGTGYTVKLNISSENGEKIARMISEEMKFAEIKNRSFSGRGEVISLAVPETYSKLFPKMFNEFYTNREHFGIQSISVDYMSIDDAFYSTYEYLDYHPGQTETTTTASVDQADSGQTSEPPASVVFRGQKVIDVKLAFLRFKSLFKKNYWMTRTSCAYMVFQVLVPLLLIISGITGANRGIRNKDLSQFGQINFGLKDYNHPITYYTIRDKGFLTAYQDAVGASAVESDKEMHDMLIETGKTNPASYRHQLIVGLKQRQKTLIAMYNSIPYTSPPLAVNLVSNALLKMLVTPKTTIKIITENHPMPFDADESLISPISGSEYGKPVLLKSICFYFSYALALICAVVTIRPMLERVSGSHHLLTMTGVNPLTFWSSYLLFDGIYICAFTAFALLIVFFSQERHIFTMHGGVVALGLILFLGGLASVAFAYFFSQLVNNAATAFCCLNMLHLIAALGSYVFYSSYDGISHGVAEAFFWVTTPFPIPLVVHALFVYSKVVIDNSRCDVISKNILNAVCSRSGLYIYLPPFSCCEQCSHELCFKPTSFYHTSYGGTESYTLLRDLVILGFSIILYLTLVIMMDNNYFRMMNRYFLAAPSEIFSTESELKDDSTAYEADAVKKLVGMGVTISEEEGLLVDGLCKNYGTIGPYSRISFSVKKGHCFGLLGMTGAGKTAIFKTLVGQELPAVGDAYISPHRMLGNPREFMSCIGYCPQKDTLYGNLTGRETLKLYGSLKGVRGSDLIAEVQGWLSLLGLEGDADRLTNVYSPSLKRRLSVGIALIGNPKVLILDEPTRDIDPVGRRQLWNIFHQLQREGKIILLASSDVQEYENLCSKVGFLLHGRLEYVGTMNGIKNKFLNGYSVTFKLSKRYSINEEKELENIADIKENIEKILVDFVFRDVSKNCLKYLIPQQGQNWGSIMETLETVRTTMPETVIYYTMTVSTVEEVFHAMDEVAKNSTNELPGAKITCCQRLCMGQLCFDEYS